MADDRCNAFPLGTVNAETLVHTAVAAKSVVESFIIISIVGGDNTQTGPLSVAGDRSLK